jgi:hypothetical protein
VLACPRISPEWEFNAYHALMKPNERTKGKIEHREAHQIWPAGGEEVVAATVKEFGERIGFAPDVYQAEGGDYLFAIPFDTARLEEAKALAAVITRRLPGIWLTFDRLLVKEGRFFRRAKGYKLRIIPATNVHVRREVRAALKGIL